MKKKRKNKKVEKKSNFEKKIEKKKKKTKRKRKKGKVSKKKKEESTVDYCCNPQCFVWGKSDFPISFRICCNIYS
jgi:hypothetical protein